MKTLSLYWHFLNWPLILGTPVVQVQATDSDIGRNAKLKYSIYNDTGMDNLTETFEIDSASGWILLKKDLTKEYENQVYQFFVRAQDKGM